VHTCAWLVLSLSVLAWVQGHGATARADIIVISVSIAISFEWREEAHCTLPFDAKKSSQAGTRSGRALWERALLPRTISRTSALFNAKSGSPVALRRYRGQVPKLTALGRHPGGKPGGFQKASLY
jgi:hypothetical protein